MVRNGLKHLFLAFKKVIVAERTPHQVALGFALGTVIAMVPMFGLGLGIAAILAIFLKKICKTSLFAAFIIYNPFVTIPLYTFSFQIGKMISTNGLKLYQPQSHHYENVFLENFFHNTQSFLTGFLILTIVLSLLGYLLVYLAVINYRKRKEKMRELRERLRKKKQISPRSQGA